MTVARRGCGGCEGGGRGHRQAAGRRGEEAGGHFSCLFIARARRRCSPGTALLVAASGVSLQQRSVRGKSSVWVSASDGKSASGVSARGSPLPCKMMGPQSAEARRLRPARIGRALLRSHTDQKAAKPRVAGQPHISKEAALHTNKSSQTASRGCPTHANGALRNKQIQQLRRVARPARPRRAPSDRGGRARDHRTKRGERVATC